MDIYIYEYTVKIYIADENLLRKIDNDLVANIRIH